MAVTRSPADVTQILPQRNQAQILTLEGQKNFPRPRRSAGERNAFPRPRFRPAGFDRHKDCSKAAGKNDRVTRFGEYRWQFMR
jgi:hypothetical protein